MLVSFEFLIHNTHTHPPHRLYSEIISTLIATGGPHAAKTSAVKLMRSVKKATLRLLDTFVEKHDDVVFLAMQFVPAMMDPILGDYARNVPDARCVDFCFKGVFAKKKEKPSNDCMCMGVDIQKS